MKKYNLSLLVFIVISSFFCLKMQADNIQLVASAPTGAPDEPTYGFNFSPSVDWFSGTIDNNYYLAALAPFEPLRLAQEENKTIAVYRFVPGTPPVNGMLEFRASAPTGQCIFDQFTQEDICDSSESFTPNEVSWFPSSINGEYFFTVVGSVSFLLHARLGLQNQQSVRVYRFNPEGTVPIEFIDSAPLQVSENEPSLQAFSVDWFPSAIQGKQYFSVVGVSNASQVRVYSFDSSAPLGTNISWVGDAANNVTDSLFSVFPLAIDWLPELVSGNSYFAVGGNSDSDPLRVYRFCVDLCQGSSDLPENHVQLVATAPTNAVLDFDIDSVNSVRWLVVDGRYYLAAAAITNSLPPLQRERTVRIYEFTPNNNDPSQSSLRFVTSAPTEKECCADETLDDNFSNPLTLDWLTQDGRHFLVTGGGRVPVFRKTSLSENSIRIYEFDASKEKLFFIAAEDLLQGVAESLDWFPGLIDKNNYFAAGINQQDNFGTADKEVRVYKFRPPCNFAAFSCKDGN